MKNRSILFFVTSMSGGGAERVANNLAKYFYEVKGIKVTFLSLKGEAKPTETYLHHSLSVANARFAFAKVRAHLKANKYDVILSFNRQLTVLLVLLRIMNRFKYKIVSRNITMLSKSKAQQRSFWHKHISDSIVRLLYNLSDSIIAQSNLMAADLYTNYRIPKDKIKVIYNPVVRGYLHKRKVLKHNRILFVGSLEPVKNISFLLSAFSSALKIRGSIELLVVGKGSLDSELRRETENLGISSKVDFIGFVDDVKPYYLKADLIVLTSLYEGLPNVLIEANSFGLPALAKDTESGANEIIISGVNGFLCKTDNAAVFGEKILKALDYPWDEEKIYETTARFDIEQIGHKYFDLMQKVVRS